MTPEVQAYSEQDRMLCFLNLTSKPVKKKKKSLQFTAEFLIHILGNTVLILRYKK